MKSFYTWAIVCLTIANISGQAFGSSEEIVENFLENDEYPEYLDYLKDKGSSVDFSSEEEDIEDFISQVVGRVERNREECPNLPERSAAEEQLKKCVMETVKKVTSLDSDEPIDHQPVCEILDSFLKCSSPLIDEMVSCGKNSDLITIIGLAKGACEYEKGKGYKVIEEIETEMKPCNSEFVNAMNECGKEEFEALEFKEIESLDALLDLFCPAGKIVRKCATVALEKHCPKVFEEVSSMYQSSRRLSGNPGAFDSCLTGSSSSSSALEQYPGLIRLG